MKVKSESSRKSNGDDKASNETGTSASMANNNDILREQMISEAAYFNAERRGFAPDSQLADWLMAEVDVTKQLANQL